MEPYPTEMRNWLVMDGAYAYRPLLKPILALGVTVVSRPRKDAGLRTLPPRKQPGKPGKRKCGLERISLVVRVVLVRESWGKWDAFFCTDPTAAARQILECYSDRSSIEQVFHDVKEVWGAGQQQVRNVWRNIGCFHLNLWMHTLVELGAWQRPAEEICNRNDSPWDNSPRRPSHADRRKALRQAFLRNGFSRAPTKHKIPKQIKQLLKCLTQLAA